VRNEDILILREVAKEYAEIAALPVHAEKRAMWKKLNAIQMERPMVLIDQIPWGELNFDGSLTLKVEDPYWRKVEEEMRQTIYKFRHMPADMVVNPYVCLPRPIIDSGWGINAKTKNRLQLNDEITSREYECQIESMEDVERIQMPVVTLDVAREAEIVQQAKVIFDGIIDFRMTGKVMHLGIWDTIAEWMGVENCYYAIVDEPEMIHALMEKLCKGLIARKEQMNALELFDVNSHICHCSQTFTDDLPGENVKATSENAWSFGLAQLFTAVSPRVTDEFEVEYMKNVFPHFGAIYYGCCDRLDDRMQYIAKLPNIRKLSCSPWSEREPFAEKMPAHCVMSNKPNPSFLAEGNLDEDKVRADIRRTIAAAKAYGRSLELIQKDISTVNGNPQTLFRWHDIAMEEVMR